MKDDNKEQESSGTCSITRDKASRQVRKYVRTSVSSVNLDQMDQDHVKNNIGEKENNQRASKEIQQECNELTKETKEPEKNKLEEVPTDNEQSDKLQSEEKNESESNEEETEAVKERNTPVKLEYLQGQSELQIEDESEVKGTSSGQILKKYFIPRTNTF